MVDFLIENWQICVSVLLAFLTLLAQFAKRKVKGYTWLDCLYQCLALVPSYCIKAENKFDNGSNKKKYVMNAVFSNLSYFVDLKSLSNDDLKRAESIISNAIEEVLSAPQRKDVK